MSMLSELSTVGGLWKACRESGGNVQLTFSGHRDEPLFAVVASEDPETIRRLREVLDEPLSAEAEEEPQ